MTVQINNPKLKKSHLTTLSKEPLVGLLTLETDQGQQRVEIDERSANGLLDEVLALFGVPRPPSIVLKPGREH